MKIAVAGGTGFVGKALGKNLGDAFEVVGLGRNIPAEPGNGFAQWIKTDFLSLLDAEKALEGVDVAFYLVHSMMPSAHLTQGRFQDFDLIAADNFARSAKKNGVRQVIYLGGLIPRGEKLSEHLKSRLEVEEALAAYGTPVTTLRASLIVGPGGSSFAIVKRLVERLPILLTPSWTKTETQPIALADVVALLRYCIGKEALSGQHFDIGGPEVLTYEKMMRLTARALGKRRCIVPIPAVSPAMSRLWVSLITGAPRSLIGPLIESLRHRMVTEDRRLQDKAKIPGTAFSAFVAEALAQDRDRPMHEEPVAFLGSRRGSPDLDVSSVQRFSLPAKASANWVAREFMRWLPRMFAVLLRVEVSEARVCGFFFWRWKKPLLILAYSAERSTDDRALFYVRGGSLALIHGRGRLEIREVLKKRYILTSVLNFRPKLPWLVYRYTQAKVHQWVMAAFGRHLRRAIVRE